MERSDEIVNFLKLIWVYKRTKVSIMSSNVIVNKQILNGMLIYQASNIATNLHFVTVFKLKLCLCWQLPLKCRGNSQWSWRARVCRWGCLTQLPLRRLWLAKLIRISCWLNTFRSPLSKKTWLITWRNRPEKKSSKCHDLEVHRWPWLSSAVYLVGNITPSFNIWYTYIASI